MTAANDFDDRHLRPIHPQEFGWLNTSGTPVSDGSFQGSPLRPKRFILKGGVSSCSRSDQARHANTPVLPICGWRLDCITGSKDKDGCPRCEATLTQVA